MARVAQDCIEVDNTIELTTASNPIVNLLTDRFPFWNVKSSHQPLKPGALKWRVCRPNDLNTLLVGTCNQLTVAGNNILAGYDLTLMSERKRREKDVINPQPHNHVPDP